MQLTDPSPRALHAAFLALENTTSNGGPCIGFNDSNNHVAVWLVGDDGQILGSHVEYDPLWDAIELVANGFGWNFGRVMSNAGMRELVRQEGRQ